MTETPRAETLPYLTLPYLTLPYLTLPYLTLPYLTSPHLNSPHLTSPHLTSPDLTSPHLTSPHLTSPHLTSPHLTHLTSPHLTSPHLTSPHLLDPLVHKAARLPLQRTRSLAIGLASLQGRHPSIFLSFSTVCLQVILGRPTFLLLSRHHDSAVIQWQLSFILRTWHIHFHRLALNFSLVLFILVS